MQVLDVWESGDTFEAFGAVLLPLLAEYGVDSGQRGSARSRHASVVVSPRC